MDVESQTIRLLKTNVPLFHRDYVSDKQKYFNTILLKNDQNFGSLLNSEVLNDNSQLIANFLSTEKHKLFKSLAPKEAIQADSPLHYSISRTQNEVLPFFVSEHTEAEYYHTSPTSYFPQKLDFKILAATTFGMNAVIIGEAGEILKDYNEYGNTYYAIAYDSKRATVLCGSASHGVIKKINAKTLEVESVPIGYSITAFDFRNDKLFFAGNTEGVENSTAIYEYNLDGDYIENMLTPRNFINDVRGLVVLPDEIYFSETYKHHIIHFNRKSRSITRVLTGFHHPNKLTLSNDGLHLFVADEHHDTVRKCNLTDFSESWRLPFGICTSPSTLLEINRGKFQGFYLIADTDGNRVILINPNNNDEIIAEIRGLRSCMAIDVAFDWPRI